MSGAVARAGGSEVVVGIGDLQFARPPVRSVVTHALGSCIGVFAWDPETQRAGLLHYMLPRADAGAEPAKFADTGLPLLLKGVAPDKATARRLRLVACGGATMNTDGSLFQIGARNATALKQFLWHMGLTLASHDLGGSSPRTARLDLSTGKVTVDSAGRSTLL